LPSCSSIQDPLINLANHRNTATTPINAKSQNIVAQNPKNKKLKSTTIGMMKSITINPTILE